MCLPRRSTNRLEWRQILANWTIHRVSENQNTRLTRYVRQIQQTTQYGQFFPYRFPWSRRLTKRTQLVSSVRLFLIRLNPFWGLNCYSTDGERIGWSLWVGFFVPSAVLFYTFLPILTLDLHSITTFYNFVSTTYNKTWHRHVGSHAGVKNLAQVVQKWRTVFCGKEPSWRLPAFSLDPSFDISFWNTKYINMKGKSRKQTTLRAC